MAILEFYKTHPDIALPPKAVWYNSDTDVLYNSASRRMRALANAGLLEKLEDPNGYYRITELGKDVISGELSKEEINELEPEQEGD